MSPPRYDLPAHDVGISRLDGGTLIGAGYAYDEDEEEEQLFLQFRLPSGEEHYLRVAGEFSVASHRDPHSPILSQAPAPLAHVRAARERFAAVDAALEGIDDGDPIHLAARDLWRAIKADLDGGGRGDRRAGHNPLRRGAPRYSVAGRAMSAPLDPGSRGFPGATRPL